MKKLINNPKNFVDETIEGILLAHPESIKCVEGNLRVLINVKKIPGKGWI